MAIKTWSILASYPGSRDPENQIKTVHVCNKDRTLENLKM